MSEITIENFESKFEEITYNLKKANFVAIDTEFTGLHLENAEPSILDSPDQRYKKLKKSVQLYNIVQLGLSAFRYCNEQKLFITDTYNFYLFPRNFGIGSDITFSMQTSCVEFLTKYNFDFHKLLYKGIPFLNNIQEKSLELKLKSQNAYQNIYRDFDEKVMQKLCSEISEFILSSNNGDYYDLLKIKELQDYIIHKELRDRFNTIWTHQDGDKIVVEKVSKERRMELEKYDTNEIRKTVDTLLGFTKVFRLLIEFKKPLVVHNGFMDMLYLYGFYLLYLYITLKYHILTSFFHLKEKFYEPLPDSLYKFKCNLNNLFPLVYDTKFISTESKRIYKEMRDLIDSTVLESLFNKLNQELPKKCFLYLPQIRHSDPVSSYAIKSHVHEAGYDAYLCGAVFLKLAHALASFDSKKLYNIKPNNMNDYFLAMKPFENKVQLIKAANEYVNLSGSDSKLQKTKLLYIKSKEPLNPAKIMKMFSPFGYIEIFSCRKHTACIAVETQNSANAIQTTFKNDPVFEIGSYDFWKHSNYLNGIKFIGVGTLILIVSGLLYKKYLN